MSKNQISILGLLILSLAVNLWQLISPASPSPPEPKPPAAEATPAQPASLPELDPVRFERGNTTRLVAAGLTDMEARHLGAAQINSEFEHAKNQLRRIDDPWLTLDEIHAESVERYRLIREAEMRRREELEALTGQNWTVADLDSSWGKVEFLLTFSGIRGGLTPDETRAMKSLIIEGAREVNFIKSTPFQSTTPSHAIAIAELVAAQEEKMRGQVGEDKFINFFKPWVMMTVEDVWSMEDRFGRPLNNDESDAIVELLMPEHPLAEIIGKSVVSSRNLPDAILPQVRELVDEEAFASLMKFHAAQ
jgi:hypothetical protein